jgi:hypothetical protein
MESSCDRIAQDRNMGIAVVNAVINLRVPYYAERFLSGCTTGGLSSSAKLQRVRLGSGYSSNATLV